MGAKIKLINQRKIIMKYLWYWSSSSDLHGCELGPEFADLMIDEYLLQWSLFANYCLFRGLKELRVKESDRLKINFIKLKKLQDWLNLFIYPSKTMK